MNDILENIKLIIEDISDISVDEINLEDSIIYDLGLSSLEIVTLIASVQEKYHIRITEKELLDIDSVEELVECVSGKQ